MTADGCELNWKYLKSKLKKEKSEVVSATTQLKLLAPDGKTIHSSLHLINQQLKPSAMDEITDFESILTDAIH